MDFVRDTLGDGRVFRALTIADDFTRESVAIEADSSLPGERVGQVLERLAGTRGLPVGIVCDNGPEFAGQVLDQWAYRRSSSSSSRANRYRTPKPRASTDGCGTSA